MTMIVTINMILTIIFMRTMPMRDAMVYTIEVVISMVLLSVDLI